MLVFSKTYTTGIGFAPNISNNIIDDILAYFVRSGYIHLANTAGTFRYAGNYGFYWSSRSAVATNAYYLNFNATGIDPSSGPVSRYIGIPLRCLSTVLGM